MHPCDAMVFASLIEFQQNQGWAGALAEIGVFFGRSLALMARAAQPSGDPVLGLDLFNIGENQRYVENLLKRLKLDRHVTLQKRNSLKLTPQDIIDTCGPVRFFSIDGGHELVHIINDTELATQTLCENGVIAFDDFMNAQYPEISRGVIQFLEANPHRLVPFAITHAKLYACTPESYDRYFAAAREFALWAGASNDTFSFMDRDLVYVQQALPARAVYQKLAERGFGGLGDRLAPKSARNFDRQ